MWGGGAEGRVEKGGDDEWVEENRGELTPLGVEQGEVVGERGAVGEEGCAAEFVKGELGGVERVDGEEDAAGEEFLCAGDAVADVPLGVGRGWRGGGRVGEGRAVAAADGAAHEDDLLEEFEGGGVAIDGGLDGGERAEGDEGDLVWMGFDGVEQEGDAVGTDAGSGETLGEGALGEGAGGGGGRAGGDGDGGVAGVGEQAGEQAGAEGGVAEGGGDAEEVELGGLQEECDGEGVVDVVTDVGVEEDELRGSYHRLGARSVPWEMKREQREEAGKERRAREQGARAEHVAYSIAESERGTAGSCRATG